MAIIHAQVYTGNMGDFRDPTEAAMAYANHLAGFLSVRIRGAHCNIAVVDAEGCEPEPWSEDGHVSDQLAEIDWQEVYRRWHEIYSEAGHD